MSTERILGILFLAAALAGLLVFFRQQSGATNHPARPALSRRKKVLFATVTLLVVSVVAYVGSIVYRSVKLYSYAKQDRGWRGHVFAMDDELGFCHVPGVIGAETLPIGPDVPMRLDENGFRVPVEATAATEAKRPLVLALGCSFTYGSCCLAEETFPHLVGERLRGRSINAGVCSYGLAQMLLRARVLIPEHKPDYVLVQYSPWLVERAQTGFAPTYFGKLPTPFFYEIEDSELALSPPVFTAIGEDLPIADYRDTDKSAGDFLSFQFRIGFWLFPHDDWHMGMYRLKRLAGAIPPPAPGDRIVAAVYGEIAELCVRHGCRMVIVAVGMDARPLPIPEPFARLPGGVVADAHCTLCDRLPEPSEGYAKAYYHWRGTPPVIVDRHPNPQAHAIIADAVVNTIEGAGIRGQE